MSWLERARRAFAERDGGRTADTAEGSPTAATAVSAGGLRQVSGASIGSNGSSGRESADKSEALREAFEERAAIMEFNGGLSREEAEREAWALVSEQLRLH